MAPGFSTAHPSTDPSPTLRPITFSTKQPRQVWFEEVILALLTRVTQEEISGFQDNQSGRLEVLFKTNQGVESLLVESVLMLHNHVDVFFEYRGFGTREVRVFHYPLDMYDGCLLSALGEYGRADGCSNERIRNHPQLLSGIRHVKLNMRRPLPNFLTIQGFVI